MLRSVDAFWRKKTVFNYEAYRYESELENIYSDNEVFDIGTEDVDLYVKVGNLTPTDHKFSHSHKAGYSCAHCGYSFGTK